MLSQSQTSGVWVSRVVSWRDIIFVFETEWIYSDVIETVWYRSEKHVIAVHIFSQLQKKMMAFPAVLDLCSSCYIPLGELHSRFSLLFCCCFFAFAVAVVDGSFCGCKEKAKGFAERAWDVFDAMKCFWIVCWGWRSEWTYRGENKGFPLKVNHIMLFKFVESL